MDRKPMLPRFSRSEYAYKVIPAYIPITTLLRTILISIVVLRNADSFAISAPIPTETGRRIHRAPTDEELAAAKRAYEALGGSYQHTEGSAWSPVHQFRLRGYLSDELIRNLPELPFDYRLEINVRELKEGLLPKLNHLKSLRHLELDLGIAGVRDGHLKEVATLRNLESFRARRCKNASDDGLALLANMPNLKSLMLFDFPVSDEGMKSLASFPALEQLNMLGWDRISDAGLKTLANCKKLQCLFLWHGNFTHVGIASLGGIRTLQVLRCSGQISKDGVVGLTRLQQLEEFALTSGNPPGVDDSALKELAKIKSLRVVTIYFGDGISDTGVREFGGLTALRELTLRGSKKITDASLKEIGKLHDLEKIDLSQCSQISDIGLKHLQTLPNLRVIELGATAVSDAGWLALLRAQRNLTEIDASHSGVSDAIVPEITKQMNLRYLRFYQCSKITDASVDTLCQMKNLRHLDIFYSGISQSGAAKIKKSLPRLPIHYPFEPNMKD